MTQREADLLGYVVYLTCSDASMEETTTEPIHSWSFSEELINEEISKGAEALHKAVVIATHL